MGMNLQKSVSLNAYRGLHLIRPEMFSIIRGLPFKIFLITGPKAVQAPNWPKNKYKHSYIWFNINLLTYWSWEANLAKA